ncbi:MFS transporter [Streptomyces purpurogeneiscleroticus]|uniref:MFS transporter n=1 Tax=Streptomyces purpurogeneiscleroticus TaxID=68259 RepID=UPI001CC15FB6|nr:MFS transporter [Streptomyces purpurogeneiscleroticus]MBZ4019930.1 MFS transporter [Streptomyces purpurogeneiscleroticus]
MSALPSEAGAPPPARPRKAAVAAWIGSALEYYDFFIYGSAAALVFPKIFFDPSDPATATLISLATFGVAYAARPIGALFLGHYGDRLGRRKIMVFTLMLMGLSTFLIGCLPTYAQVGTAAPVLLVLMRVLQGLSAAGEQASANSMTLEHAPEHRRGYYTSFALNGTQAGQIIATLVFIPVAALPEEQLYTWGWRLPFLVSVAVTVAGYLIRRKLTETPVFEQAAAEDAVAKLPLADLLRNHWADVLRVIAAALIATVSTIFSVWALAYATSDAVGLDKSAMLWVGVLANAVALLAIPLWAKLSDRIGRKPVFLIGSLGSAVMIFVYLWAVSTGSYPLVFLTGIVFFGVVYSAANGIWPSFYGEMFPTRVRLSGMAIGTQIGFAVAGFAVSIAERIAGSGGTNWLGVAAFTAGTCVICSLAVLTGRETYRVPTALLGEKQDPARDRGDLAGATSA